MSPVVSYFYQFFFTCFFFVSLIKKLIANNQMINKLRKLHQAPYSFRNTDMANQKKTINIKYIWVVLVIWMYQRQWQYYIFYCSFYIGVNYCGREEICSHIFHCSAGCSSFEIPYLEQLNSPQSGGECGRGKIKMLKWVELGRWGFIGGGEGIFWGCFSDSWALNRWFH